MAVEAPKVVNNKGTKSPQKRKPSDDSDDSDDSGMIL